MEFSLLFSIDLELCWQDSNTGQSIPRGLDHSRTPLEQSHWNYKIDRYIDICIDRCIDRCIEIIPRFTSIDAINIARVTSK